MRCTRFITFFALSILCLSLTVLAQITKVQGQEAAVLSLDAQRSLVGQYCAGCHNDTVKSGGFSWNTVELAHPEQSAEHIEKAIRKLRAGLMPPPGRPRPDAATLKKFASTLESNIDRAAAAHPFVGR